MLNGSSINIFLKEALTLAEDGELLGIGIVTWPKDGDKRWAWHSEESDLGPLAGVLDILADRLRSMAKTKPS